MGYRLRTTRLHSAGLQRRAEMTRDAWATGRCPMAVYSLDECGQPQRTTCSAMPVRSSGRPCVHAQGVPCSPGTRRHGKLACQCCGVSVICSNDRMGDGTGLPLACTRAMWSCASEESRLAPCTRAQVRRGKHERCALSITHQLCDSGVRWALQNTLLQWGQSPAILSAADGHWVGLAVIVGLASVPSALVAASAGGETGML